MEVPERAAASWGWCVPVHLCAGEGVLWKGRGCKVESVRSSNRCARSKSEIVPAPRDPKKDLIPRCSCIQAL